MKRIDSEANVEFFLPFFSRNLTGATKKGIAIVWNEGEGMEWPTWNSPSKQTIAYL